MGPVKIPQSEVAKLGDEDHIREHYVQEGTLNELLALIDESADLLARWPKLSKAEQATFLQQRDATVAHGDGLSRQPVGTPSPLLMGLHPKAVAAWRTVRPQLMGLG